MPRAGCCRGRWPATPPAESAAAGFDRTGRQRACARTAIIHGAAAKPGLRPQKTRWRCPPRAPLQQKHGLQAAACLSAAGLLAMFALLRKPIVRKRTPTTARATEVAAPWPRCRCFCGSGLGRDALVAPTKSARCTRRVFAGATLARSAAKRCRAIAGRAVRVPGCRGGAPAALVMKKPRPGRGFLCLPGGSGRLRPRTRPGGIGWLPVRCRCRGGCPAVAAG